MKNYTKENEKKAKKDRVVWSEDLHHKFVNAVNNAGGIDKATPKKILLLMKGENLTKGNVASHLQKYRLHLKRVSSTFHQNQKGLAQFHEINDVAVHNGYQSGISQAIPTLERVSNQGPYPLFNGTFSQWLHDNENRDFNFYENENWDFNFYENENWDFNFDEWDHGNGLMELSEENSSLMEQHQGNFGNEKQQSQSNCMATNLGLVQDSVNTSSGCSSQESHGIAELRHEITTVRHENSQLLQIVQAMKARQDMLEQLLLQRTVVQPERLMKQ